MAQNAIETWLFPSAKIIHINQLPFGIVCCWRIAYPHSIHIERKVINSISTTKRTEWDATRQHKSACLPQIDLHHAPYQIIAICSNRTTYTHTHEGKDLMIIYVDAPCVDDFFLIPFDVFFGLTLSMLWWCFSMFCCVVFIFFADHDGGFLMRLMQYI